MGIQKIVIRGLSVELFHLNGMKVNNQQWANDHGMGFTDLGLSEIELIKGALLIIVEAVGGLVLRTHLLQKVKFFWIFCTKFDNSHF